MAAMEKDIQANPSLKHKYGNVNPIAPVEEPVQKKTVRKEKVKAVPKPPAEKPKPPTPPQTPEQESRIGKWQSIEPPKYI